MILLAASGLFAAIDADQRDHEAAARTLAGAVPPLLLSPFVAAEMDYLLATRSGVRAELTCLEDVAAAVYSLEPFTSNDVELALDVLRQYGDLNIGLADASIVVLAERHNARDVLTLDERHFRALRDNHNRPFRLLPADAS